MDQPRKSSRYRYPSVVEVAEVLAGARHWLPWEREAPPGTPSVFSSSYKEWHGAGPTGWATRSLPGAESKNGTRQPGGWDSDAELCEWLPAENCQICDKPFYRRACFKHRRLPWLGDRALRPCAAPHRSLRTCSARSRSPPL
jgi:hypothetical protein